MSRKLPNLNQKTPKVYPCQDDSNTGIYWMQRIHLGVGIISCLLVGVNNLAQLPQNFDISKNILFSSCIPGLEKAKPEARKIE